MFSAKSEIVNIFFITVVQVVHNKFIEGALLSSPFDDIMFPVSSLSSFPYDIVAKKHYHVVLTRWIHVKKGYFLVHYTHA